MDESPNSSENEEPKARLGRFSPSGYKKAIGGLVGFMARDALRGMAKGGDEPMGVET
jgi:hypothetical protein